MCEMLYEEGEMTFEVTSPTNQQFRDQCVSTSFIIRGER